MKQFLKHLILLMACIAAITAVLVLAKFKYILPINFVVIVYFSAICFIAQYLLFRTLAKNPKRFPQVFMLVEFAKLFLHIIVLAGYIYAHRTEPFVVKSFLVYFAALFVIYLIFGTWKMYRIARKQ